MRPATERVMLRLAVAVACLVPLAAGTAGVVRGAAFVHGPPPSDLAPDLDSHFRYLSGIFLGVGVAFASCVPRIEANGPRFRLLGALVVAGGCARVLSLAEAGAPSAGHLFGLVMELGVVPLLLLWQARVARLYRAPAPDTPLPDMPAPVSTVGR